MIKAGLKVFGEGEWKVRTHGASKRRTWRKLHLCLDALTHEILVIAATENSISDGEAFVPMLAAVEEEIEQISADGAYDRRKVYDAMNERKIKRAAIPPRKGARIWQTWQQQRRAADSRRKSARQSAHRTCEMEARIKLSSAEFSGDGGLSIQNNFDG